MKRNGLTFGFLAAVSWGLSTVLTKWLLAEVEPLPLLTTQLLFSSLFVWLVLLAQHPEAMPIRRALKLSLPGLLQPGLAFVLATVGLSLTTASCDTLIWATETIVVVVLSWAILHEQISLRLIALAVLGVFGTALATFTPGGGNVSILGNVLICIAVVAASFYTISIKRQLDEVEPIRLFALHQMSALALVIPIGFLVSPGGFHRYLRVESILISFLTAVSGVMLFGLPFCLYMTTIRELGAARSALLLNLPPVVTLIGSFLFLGERLTWLQWIGAGGALIAVTGISLIKEKY
jgi:probable blue pigment (indigoidine) exporter